MSNLLAQHSRRISETKYNLVRIAICCTCLTQSRLCTDTTPKCSSASSAYCHLCGIGERFIPSRCIVFNTPISLHSSSHRLGLHVAFAWQTHFETKLYVFLRCRRGKTVVPKPIKTLEYVYSEPDALQRLSTRPLPLLKARTCLHSDKRLHPWPYQNALTDGWGSGRKPNMSKGIQTHLLMLKKTTDTQDRQNSPLIIFETAANDSFALAVDMMRVVKLFSAMHPKYGGSFLLLVTLFDIATALQCYSCATASLGSSGVSIIETTPHDSSDEQRIICSSSPMPTHPQRR